jgi:phage regulator Rha-like protein
MLKQEKKRKKSGKFKGAFVDTLMELEEEVSLHAADESLPSNNLLPLQSHAEEAKPREKDSFEMENIPSKYGLPIENYSNLMLFCAS